MNIFVFWTSNLKRSPWALGNCEEWVYFFIHRLIKPNFKVESDLLLISQESVTVCRDCYPGNKKY